MPIRVQNDLPIKEVLEQENIFVMDEYRAAHQEIRPISIGLLNLMPLKEDTELQILRSLSKQTIRALPQLQLPGLPHCRGLCPVCDSSGVEPAGASGTCVL